MAFDPKPHLMKLSGKDYLETRWRLAWVRDEHPDATIETELVAFDVAQEWCIVKATVTIPGRGSATGMAFQKPTAIAKDYVANGETSAIGRALGALGFGTQFALEFDQGDQVVDSPVGRSTPPPARSIPGALDELRQAVGDTSYTWLAAKELCMRHFGTVDPTTLTRVEQIDALKGVVLNTHHEKPMGGGRWAIEPGPAPAHRAAAMA